jgi:hypothetical protein
MVTYFHLLSILDAKSQVTVTLLLKHFFSLVLSASWKEEVDFKFLNAYRHYTHTHICIYFCAQKAFKLGMSRPKHT